jgi:hypothetical protein
MYCICNFLAYSLYFQIIDNPDNLLTLFYLICLNHQSFRPSKFELAVMDFLRINEILYKIYRNHLRDGASV